MYACKISNSKISENMVKMLLELGADVSIVNRYKRKAIHYARTPKVLRMLIDHGADPKAKDKNGNTPIKLFSRKDRVDPRVLFLKELGVTED